MLEAILFDLDDTLLGNSMESFLPAYFQALTQYVDHVVSPERLLAELQRATAVMNGNAGDGPTNEEVFAETFYPALGCERDRMERLFQRFYAEEFPRLQKFTQRRPAARRLVEWAFEEGLQVVIATNPLFPRVAVEERLAWAGVPVEAFDYALVTTYENMHATKSHPAYYREILEKLGRERDDGQAPPPGRCLMAGDDWEMDVVPASSEGIPVYWIAGPDAEPPREEPLLVGRGELSDLWARVRAEDDALI